MVFVVLYLLIGLGILNIMYKCIPAIATDIDAPRAEYNQTGWVFWCHLYIEATLLWLPFIIWTALHKLIN